LFRDVNTFGCKMSSLRLFTTNAVRISTTTRARWKIAQ